MFFFLRVKSWLLFMLMFVLPAFIMFAFKGFLYAPYLAYMVYVTVWMGWLLSVARGIYKLEARDFTSSSFFWFKVSPKAFQWAVSYVLVYLLLTPFSFYGELFESYTIVVLIHISAIFFIWYIVFFTAEVFAAHQKGEGARLMNSSFGSFMMFYFHPIGLWSLQPKINKIFEKG